MEKNDESPVYDCVVIGAGISGLMAASELERNGLKVIVLDKSRGVGGRMATRRFCGGKFDHGAQFFTVMDDTFRKYVEDWEREGLVSPWFGAEERRIRYRVQPSMTGIAKKLASSLNVNLSFQVKGTHFENGLWRVSGEKSVQGRSLLFTSPVPQSLKILQDSGVDLRDSLLEDLKSVSYRKALVAMLSLDGPSGLGTPGFLKLEAGGAIDVIADNQQKGISDVSAITVHSSHDFADTHFDDDKETVLKLLIEEATPFLDSKIVESSYHRWRFAHRDSESKGECAHEIDKNIWFAGDSFGAPKIEGAALSGLNVAQSILTNLSKKG